MNSPFEALPFVNRTRELKSITGGSLSCGWMYDEIAFLVYGLIKWHKPELVVQTGHLWGKSALIALEALNDGFLSGHSSIEESEQNAQKAYSEFVRKNRPPISGRAVLVSIDDNPLDVPRSDAGIAYLKRLYSNFYFFNMDSSEFFEREIDNILTDLRPERILGIVDADHSMDGCRKDLLSLSSIGAQLILLDDTSWIQHIGGIAREFADAHGYQLLNLNSYNGMGVLWKNDASRPS
jgi:hypothetical protein